MPKKIDLTGQRFGRLLVLNEARRDKHESVLWQCQCDCGNLSTVSGASLRAKNSVSCGCYRREAASKANSTHRQSRVGKVSPTYKVWLQMRQRCYNPNSPRYKNYGGQGIAICKRWQDFENFHFDMGDKPQGLSIEREDNSDGYKPSNCKWATDQEQMHNKRARGYCWNKQKGKWRAYIKINSKKIHLGNYDNEKDARQAYLEGKKKYHLGGLEQYKRDKGGGE